MILEDSGLHSRKDQTRPHKVRVQVPVSINRSVACAYLPKFDNLGQALVYSVLQTADSLLNSTLR